MWRSLYALVLWLALPVVLARLWWRARRESGYREALAQRFGVYGSDEERPARPLIWLHAVSLGETRAAAPLFERLRALHPECDFLVTHMTATGREAAGQLFGGKARLAWLPYDYGFAAKRFVRHFRPALGILLETEVWFNLVRGCREAGVPLLLANARLSDKSLRGYETVAPLAREAFGALSAVAAQSDQDARRIAQLGAKAIEVTGNLKFDVRPSAETERLARQFRESYRGRRVFLAASTRAGEEEALLEALEENSFPALVVIVPRHPDRFAEVETLLSRAGVAYVRRSSGTAVPDDCRFVLGDSLGEMAAYYAAADVAFVGGSLLAYGGQNLIEACAAGVPVLIGPFTYNFAEAAQAALAEGAAERVADARQLAACARLLLEDERRRAAMGSAGRAFCDKHRGATERVAAIADRLLAER